MFQREKYCIQLRHWDTRDFNYYTVMAINCLSPKTSLSFPLWRMQSPVTGCRFQRGVHRSIEPQNTEFIYITASESKIISLTQNNIVNILFMEVHDYVCFIPGFVSDRLTVLASLSISPYLLCLAISGFPEKLIHVKLQVLWMIWTPSKALI